MSLNPRIDNLGGHFILSIIAPLNLFFDNNLLTLTNLKELFNNFIKKAAGKTNSFDLSPVRGSNP